MSTYMTAAHWSEGYATGATYSHHYFDDLNPLRAAFVMLLEGLDGPPPGPCCELGFGQGLSLAMHAAGDPTRRWWGTDFIPEHAVQARRLVDAAGVDAQVGDQSFAEFFARDDLPQFAFITLHGVWSWVSAANRARIVGFLGRHLLPGGVVYLSFNALPGFAPLLPLRQVMLEHFRLASPAGRPDAARAHEAMAFVQRLLALKPAVLGLSPSIADRLAELAGKPPNYLLHELLNEDWQAMSFAQLASELEPAKLSFVVSSDLHYRFTDVHLSKAQQEQLAQIESRTLRESVRDLMLAQSLRGDYWMRGARPLSRAEVSRRLRETRFVLAMAPRDVPRTVQGLCGSTDLAADRLTTVLGALEDADAPVELGRLLDHTGSRGFDPNEVLNIVAALVGMRAIYPAASAAQVEAARPATQRLNAYLSGPHARRADIHYLASPITAGGVPVPVPVQMMLAARDAAPQQPESWAGRVWEAMQADGQQMMKGHERVTDRDTALATLRPLMQQMQEQALPHLQRLGVTN
jgi:SAM-dependent methyltransferase